MALRTMNGGSIFLKKKKQLAYSSSSRSITIPKPANRPLPIAFGIFVLNQSPSKENSMYAAVKGVYENGQIKFTEPVPTTEKSEVIITFLGAEESATNQELEMPRVPGSLKRWGEARGLTFSIPDDFNAPLDDLADYM